jgi:hypothetical protein
MGADVEAKSRVFNITPIGWRARLERSRNSALGVVEFSRPFLDVGWSGQRRSSERFGKWDRPACEVGPSSL